MGIAHLFPTGLIVKGFGSISDDNKRIITMELIAEAAALIFIGSVVLLATIVEPAARVSVLRLHLPAKDPPNPGVRHYRERIMA